MEHLNIDKLVASLENVFQGKEDIVKFYKERIRRSFKLYPGFYYGFLCGRLSELKSLSSIPFGEFDEKKLEAYMVIVKKQIEAYEEWLKLMREDLPEVFIEE